MSAVFCLNIRHYIFLNIFFVIIKWLKISVLFSRDLIILKEPLYNSSAFFVASIIYNNESLFYNFENIRLETSGCFRWKSIS